MDYPLEATLPQCCHRLLKQYASTDDIPLPLSHTQQAAVMFLDLSRFTKLTETASHGGRYGVEVITSLLDAYFSVVVKSVRRHGGSLLKYGGDSTLSLFPGAIDDAGARALTCRSEVLAAVGEGFRVKGVTEPVKLHGAVGYGEVNLLVTGDPAIHLDYYPSGDVLTRVFRKGDEANAGEVLLMDGIESLEGQTSAATIEAIDCKLATDFLAPSVKRRIASLDFRAELRNTAVCFLQLDDEDGGETISPEAYHNAYIAMQRLVNELGGAINKIDYTDKGYMAILTFGAPDMHYDDIERAFTCAYRLQRLQLPGVRLRIGVTCDNIYAGLLGAKERFEYGIIGNAVNTAARLMAACDWGGVAFSQEIQPRIAARFESEFVRRVEVKGITQPVELHRLIRELPESWNAYRQRCESVQMLGRNKLLASVRDRIANRRHVLLLGDAGVGKSLLAYHLLCPYIDSGEEALLLALDEFDSRRQLGLVSRLLDSLADLPPLPEGLEQLISWLEAQDAAIDLAPLQRAFETAQTQPEDIDLACELLADALAIALRNTPLLTVDNAQWFDSLSRKTMQALAPRVDGQTAIVLASREESDDWPQQFEQHTLKPFNSEHSTALLKTHLPDITDDAVQSLQNITGGNPLFVGEMGRIIAANRDRTGAILNAAEIRILVRKGVIPESMENLLLTQYERLDMAAQRVLRIASIVGRAFSVETLRVVGGAEFTREVLDVLASLETNAFINENNIHPEIEYIFSNNLMREAIYRTVPLGEKRDLHRRIAALYANRADDDASAWCEVTANHYILGEDDANIRVWAMCAAERSRSLGAVSEALFYYRAVLRAGDESTLTRLRVAEALQLLGRVDEADAELAAYVRHEPPEGEERDLLRYLRLKAQTIRTDFAGVKSLYESWREPCVSDWLGDMQRILYLEALQATGELDIFERKALEYLDELESRDDREFLGRLASLMGVFYREKARYAEAEEWFLRKLESAEATGDKLGVRIAQSHLGVTASRRGDKQQAAEWYRKALETAERIGDKGGYGKTLMDIAILERNAGRNEKARELYRRCLELARQIGDRRQEQTVLYNFGESLFYDDRVEEAQQHFLQALAIAKEIHDRMGESYCYDALGDSYFTLGDFETAHSYYNKNVPLQQQLGDNEGLAHTYGNLGNIAKMAKDWDAAIERYSTQQRMLAEIGDRDGEGRAWFNWAMIHVEKQDDAAAVAPLQNAIERFRACEAQQLTAIAEEQMTELRKRLSST